MTTASSSSSASSSSASSRSGGSPIENPGCPRNAPNDGDTLTSIEVANVQQEDDETAVLATQEIEQGASSAAPSTTGAGTGMHKEYLSMDHTINSTGIDADADADNHTEHKKKSPPDTGTGSDNYDPSKESMTVATSSTKVHPELANSNLFASDHTAEFPLPEPLPEPLLSPNNYLPHQGSNNVGAHAIPGFGLVGAYAVQGIGRETEESKQQNDAQPHPQNTPDEESGLVQAQPVQDEPIRMTAQPVYQQEQQQQPNGRQRFLIIGIPLIILLVCVVVGVSLAVGLAKNGNKDMALQVPDDTMGMLPSTSNTTLLPNDTTNQPTDPTNDTVVLEFQQLLPNYTQTSLEDPFSPQSQALTWVVHHQYFENLPDWRKKQLFALATFFYSFQGPNWPSIIQDSWLDDQRHECNWFSNNYGTFTDDGSFQQGITEFTSMDSCSSTGEFVDLALGNVDLSLSAIQPIHIPPEISMLTGLLYLHLYENEIHGNIMEILPTQLFQMTSLLEIGLRKNALTGQIPSELGLLTRLYLVELAGNKLTGRIPSELGATVFSTFKVCCNQLTGSLPNELLAPGLANMDEFNVQHNMLTGTIPSEIWTSWTKLVVLQLGDNLFSGQGIPTQLNGSHSLPDLVELDLSHLPLLTGSLPTFELANLATNFNLSIIEMDKSPGFWGEIPEELCFLQDPTCSFEFWWWPMPRNCSLTFDCTPSLCGCDCLC